MNIAPPPLIRRTTWKPYFSALPRSTSFFTDWKLPMTTPGSFHSQMRRVGLRRPAPDFLGEHLVQRHLQHRRIGVPWISCQS